MASVMQMRWNGVTTEQYDELVTWHDAHAIYNPQALMAGAPA